MLCSNQLSYVATTVRDKLSLRKARIFPIFRWQVKALTQCYPADLSRFFQEVRYHVIERLPVKLHNSAHAHKHR